MNIKETHTMKVLIFDTETTGLPKTRNTQRGRWWKNFPYIVQMSWIVYDADQSKFLDIQDFIVRLPDGIGITPKSTSIHGITNERMRREGVSIHTVITFFKTALEACDVICGHNLEFDYNMVRAELQRNGYINFFDVLKRKKMYCTMKETVDLCKISAVRKWTGEHYLKYPRLSELHNHLFGEAAQDLHNSMTDVLVTLRCYMMIEHNVDLRETSDTFTHFTQDIYV